jgi:hypothetical protein
MTNPVNVPISRRRDDIDNLRNFLTGLVVVHHTGVAYGGPGGWYYHSPLFPPLGSPLVTIFEAVNQSFFMGLFFWVSGLMSAQSLRRWPTGVFVKRKIIRLGIPSVIYTLLLQPITICMVHAGWDLQLIAKEFTYYYRGLRGIQGPTWFPALLLVFDLCTAGIEQLRSRQSPEMRDTRPPLASWYRVISRWGWLVVAVTCFLIRLIYPVGQTTSYIIALLPGYVPQYIFAYYLGYMAYYVDEPRLVGLLDSAERPAAIQLDPTSRPEPEAPTHDESSQQAPVNPVYKSRPFLYLWGSLTLSLLAMVLVGVISGIRDTAGGDDDDSRGGWNIAALGYAFWNEFSFITIGPALMAAFSAWYDSPATLWIWQPRYSYAAFLLHPPVIVILDSFLDRILVGELGVDKWSETSKLWMVLGPIILTFSMGVLGAAASFVVGRWVVTYVPWVKRAV